MYDKRNKLSDNVDFRFDRLHLGNTKADGINFKLSCLSTECECVENQCQLSRIVPVGSPVLTVYHYNLPVNITIDSGATTSFIT